MDKKHVKKRLEELQAKVIKDLETAYQRDYVSADIDEAETKDPEDFSHQGELGEMARRMQIHLNSAKDALKYVSSLPEDATDQVTTGALVETEERIFYVSIATHPFEVDGRSVVGISTEAPIYSAMHGKRAGDTFKYGDKSYKIIRVS